MNCAIFQRIVHVLERVGKRNRYRYRYRLFAPFDPDPDTDSDTDSDESPPEGRYVLMILLIYQEHEKSTRRMAGFLLISRSHG